MESTSIGNIGSGTGSGSVCVAFETSVELSGRNYFSIAFQHLCVEPDEDQ